MSQNFETVSKNESVIVPTVEKEEVDSLEQTSFEVLTDAVNEFSNVLKMSREIEVDVDATPDEKKEIGNLLVETGARFSRLYKEIKRLAGIVPMLFVLLEPGHEVDKVEKGIVDRKTELSVPVEKRKLSHISVDQLPFSIAMADKTLEGNPVIEYNKMVDFFNKRVDGKMTEEEILYKEELAQNIEAFGYNNNGTNVESYIITNGEGTPLNKFKEYKKGKHLYSKENIKKTDLKHQIRVDMFRKYLGLPEFGDYIKESPHKPTMAKNLNAQYYSFDSRSVVNSLKDNIDLFIKNNNKEKSLDEYSGSTSEDILKIKSFKDLENYTKKYKELPPSIFLSGQLGEYGAYVGHDEEKNEDYISYYDLWDLDPPYLKDIGIDINQFNFPFEVYGRIYESDWDTALDKKL